MFLADSRFSLIDMFDLPEYKLTHAFRQVQPVMEASTLSLIIDNESRHLQYHKTTPFFTLLHASFIDAVCLEIVLRLA